MVSRVGSGKLRISVDGNTHRAIVNLINGASIVSIRRVRNCRYISGIVHIRIPCGQTDQTFRPRSSIVPVNGKSIAVNNGGLTIVTNPYSVRAPSRVRNITYSITGTNTGVLHNNTFGPHASPCSFRNLNGGNLSVLHSTNHGTGLPIVARVVSTSGLPIFLRSNISVVRVKTQGVRGFSLLGTINGARGPILLGQNLDTAVRR